MAGLYKGDNMAVEKKNYDLPQTFDVLDVEIFSAGKPKGHVYSDVDIEEIVKGFSETKSELKPYLKLGHDYNKKDVSFSSVSGMPAVGWVENLRKVGKKIVADFKQVPKKVYELIKAQAYKRVSSEIFWNIEVNGKKYNRLLKAVSLLGADTPAVGNLDDIIALYKSDSEVQEYQFDIENNKIKEVNYQDNTKTKKKEEQRMAELDELKKENKKYQEDLKKSEDEKKVAEDKAKVAEDEKKEAEKGKKVAEDELGKKKDAETKAEATATVEKLIADGHWYPADKDTLVAKFIADRSMSEVKKYKIGEEEKTFEEFFINALSKFTVDLNTAEISETGDVTSKKDNLATKNKAEKYAKDNNVSYTEALVAISK